MADKPTTLLWPNLATHNLMAQLVVNSRGVNTLLIRPIQPDEPESKSATRAQTLDTNLQRVANQIGDKSKFQARLVQGSLNAMVGRMIDTPAKMSAFLQKIFPKATLMDMPIEAIRQEEAVRREAMAFKDAQAIHTGTPFDQASMDALNAALPDTLTFALEGERYTLRESGSPEDQPLFTAVKIEDTPNNEVAREIIRQALEEAWRPQRTDNLDTLHSRLVDLNNHLENRTIGFWATQVARIEKDLLTRWETEAKAQVDALITQDTRAMDSDALKTHLDALKAKLDNQGNLDNPALNKAIRDTQDRIINLSHLAETPELGGGQDGVLDNVQDNEDLEGEDEVVVSLGFTAAGDELFEDSEGARFKLQRGERVREHLPGLPFTAEGRPLMPGREKLRGLDWLTMEEALAQPYSGLSLEMRLRAGFEAQVSGAEDRRAWVGLTLEHQAQRQPVMVREFVPAEHGKPAVLQALYLDARALNEGEPVTVNAQLMRLDADNRLLNEGLPQKAPEILLKNWATLGLSLPENTPQSVLDALDGAKVGPSTSHEGIDNEPNNTGTDTEDAGGSSVRPGDSGTSDTEGLSTGLPAGSGSGRDTDDRAGLSGRDGDGVSDGVADRDDGDGSPEGADLREPGDPESSDGTAGDQRGEEADAEAPVRGPDGGGDREPGYDDTGAGTADDRGSDNPGLGATDGSDAHVSGSPDGAPEEELAEESAADRSAGGSDGSEAGVPDSADGESSEPATTDDGTAAGDDRNAGGAAGQPGVDDQAPTGGAPVSEPERAAGEGADRDSDADGERGGVGVGGDDWERFADEQSAAGDERIEPLRGNRELEERTGRQRLIDNLKAISLLREVQGDAYEPDLTATFTLEEREILAAYSGFGGIHPRMFDKTWERHAPEWVAAATRDINAMPGDGLLTREHVESIKSTILNAYYTHSGVIEPMWEAIDRMGLPLDRVLEPSCGSGHFKAFMPESVAEKVGSFTGVEIDPLTARIAQATHPDTRIINSGFEKTTFPDSFFDAVISNVPFGDYKVFDPQKPERRDNIHNAFFLKALDKVRPGGVIAFVTSSYTMDSKNNAIRQQIMDQSHVMGAYRLPAGTFKKTAGTEVITDVIFLQKKGNFTLNYEPLNILDTQRVQAPLATASSIDVLGKEIQPGEMVPGFEINQAFAENPERIIGSLEVVSGPYGPDLSVTGGGTIDEQREALRSALASLPSNVTTDSRKTVTADDLDAMILEGSQNTKALADLPDALSIENDQIYVVTTNDKGQTLRVPDTQIPKNMQARAKAAITTMVALSDLLDAETKGEESDEQLDARRADVRDLIAGWEKLEQKTKAAFSKKAWDTIQRDPRAQRIQFKSLYDAENRTVSQPDIVHGRTVRPMTERPAGAETIEDALAISLAYTAQISETYMVDLLKESHPDIDQDTLRAELISKGLAFVDPTTDEMVERSIYLSGNLRPKIVAIESIIDSAPEFQVNLDALEAALPAPLSASQIKVSLDAFWLPSDVINDFLSEALDLRTDGPTGVQAYFDDVQRHWRLKPTKDSGAPSMASIANAQEHVTRTRWGTPRKSALELLDNAFTNTIPKVMDPIPGTEPTRYMVNAEETLKAQAKFEEIKDAFDRWIYKSPDRAQRLIDIYNRDMNATVLYDPDGSHMVFPGMAESWVPRKHQSDFIWRAVSGKNAMTAHVVGAGKTLQLIGTCIRGKQMGRWRKGLVVVPNHMLEQFANDGQDIYPNAKILVMTAADARAANRAAFAAKAAMGDWDMIVCTHSVFEKITVPQEFEAKIIDREIAKLRAALEDEGVSKTPKEVEKAIKKLEERLERTHAKINENSENILNMAEIGVDFVGVDEAHYYKNLMLDTTKSIPGVSNASSKRALNMLIKCQYLREIHDDCRGVMMATGTPISNSMTECYTFTRMLRPDLLEEYGIKNFNDWMGLFGSITHGMEIKPEGGGYQMKSRLSNFKNIPELVKMIRTFIDFKTREDLNLPSPKVHHETVTSDQTDFMQGFMKYIEARAKAIRRSKNESPGLGETMAMDIRGALYKANDKNFINEETGELEEDAIPEPTDDILLTVATDGRKVSLDPRLIHPEFEDNPSSKVNKAIKNMLALYRQYDEEKALQLVFCDFSSPTGSGIFNVYEDVKKKLMANGVDESEIAFIHDAKTDTDKENMFAKARSGEIRFLLGSTQKMGVGTNVQERLVALHELDPPWKPSDIEQRLGRMDRQGNSFKNVYCYRYVTVDSFDLFMWSTLNRKLKMVNQALRRPEDCAREISEDAEPSYEDIMAVTTGNESIKEYMDTRQLLNRYKRMQSSHLDVQADLGNKVLEARRKVERIESFLKNKIEEQELVQKNQPMALYLDHPVPKLCEGPMMVTGGLKSLGKALETLALQAPRYRTSDIGTFGGLTIKVSRMGGGPTILINRLEGRNEPLIQISDTAGYQSNLGDGFEEVDEYYDAAKTLVRYVRKIGNDNGIEKTRVALASEQENLTKLEADIGAPFPYEEEMKKARTRHDALLAEVGDAIDEDKPIDPLPILDFSKAINRATGAHDDLVYQLEMKVVTNGPKVLVSKDDLDDDEDLDLIDAEPTDSDQNRERPSAD